jgi:hypothetical protein
MLCVPELVQSSRALRRISSAWADRGGRDYRARRATHRAGRSGVGFGSPGGCSGRICGAASGADAYPRSTSFCCAVRCHSAWLGTPSRSRCGVSSGRRRSWESPALDRHLRGDALCRYARAFADNPTRRGGRVRIRRSVREAGPADRCAMRHAVRHASLNGREVGGNRAPQRCTAAAAPGGGGRGSQLDLVFKRGLTIERSERYTQASWGTGGPAGGRTLTL